MASKKYHEAMFDVRVVSQRIRTGSVTAEAYQSFVGKLPDLAGKSAICETPIPNDGSATEPAAGEQGRAS